MIFRYVARRTRDLKWRSPVFGMNRPDRYPSTTLAREALDTHILSEHFTRPVDPDEWHQGDVKSTRGKGFGAGVGGWVYIPFCITCCWNQESWVDHETMWITRLTE